MSILRLLQWSRFKLKPQNNLFLNNLEMLRGTFTREIAMGCEMVCGYDNQDILARVSIVNGDLQCIYDKYVKPEQPVKDFRTEISGIRPHDMENGESFQTVRRDVTTIIAARVLVGHSIQHDLDALFLTHPQHKRWDTQSLGRFKAFSSPHPPGLMELARRGLGIEIQRREHSSVEDAMTTMKLYKKYKNLGG